MPTITISPDDLDKLVGQKLDEKKLTWLLDHAKAELDAKLTNELIIKYNDTNLPYLWSVEGLARLFKQVLGKQKGIPELKLEKTKDTITHDKRLTKIRPHIACFKATGVRIDDYLLKQIIQMQEKLSENFGKKRQKISIGVYPLKNIEFPVQCKAVNGDEKFTPLDFYEPITLKQTIEKHPKGKEYGHLIGDTYPVFIDAKKQILSLIPIINSEQTGRLKTGDDALFFDTTGTEEETVNLVANIFANALAERGFTIHPITIDYGGRKITTPTLQNKKMKFDEKEIEKLLGIKLNGTQIKEALNKMGYEYSAGTVTIPNYRNDIMHTVDITEDIAIATGYDKLEPLPLTAYTVGGTLPKQQKIDTQRTLWIGLEYQEILSAVLSNKELLNDKMNTKTTPVEIENYVSQTYSCIRTWIIPQLLEFLSKNKHVEYPQKIFEQGPITTLDKEAKDEQHIAAITAHSSATFTEIKQATETTLRNMGINYKFEEHEENYYIPGRAAKIIINGKQAGTLGEIHPAILEKFGLLVPAAAVEINLDCL